MNPGLDLRELQLAQLECLKAVASTCDELELDYFLDFGTLLGACRHGGFIPWDDDIDISMPRHDFQTLAREGPALLPPKYSIEFASSTPGWMKVNISDFEIHLSSFSPGETLQRPLSLDIFPVDCYKPWPKLKRGAQVFSRVAVTRAYSRDYARQIWATDKTRSALLFALSVVPKKALERSFGAILSEQESPHLLGHGYATGDGPEYLPSKMVFPTSTVNFEGWTFRAPRDPETYLTEIYGNWRRLPPVSERAPSHTIGTVRGELPGPVSGRE